MDGVSHSLQAAPDAGLMPPEAPLARPIQRFDRAFRDDDAPGPSPLHGVWVRRMAAFAPPVGATLGLLTIMQGWFDTGGISAVEALLIGLICFNFFWITLTVSTVLLGLVSLARQPRRRAPGQPQPQQVALLMPVYNEDPAYVMGNARAMLEQLRAQGGPHDYTLFVLSDTRNEVTAAQERMAVYALRNAMPDMAIHYRRRAENTDRKVGNIADWVERWGAAYPAMLVLDADSLMTGRAISRLADALARDPSAGLIQSFPQLIGAQSVFARAQQFASGVYGAALAEGLAQWAGDEANYWGHNAILRTAAFARTAGLPHLRRGRRTKLIMSHDFVEAGLMRRAGWAVRFLPRIRGSYEESPATLLDHVARDRRWCQGNLQHLRLLGARGLHAVSRFHLFHGAMGYLLSPLWFCLLVIWALLGNGEEASVLTYFSEANPLFPTWPEMNEGRHLLVLLLMYAMLLMPKLLGVAALRLTGARFSEFGGPLRLGAAVLTEILLSVAYAPILMVQQMIAVVRTLTGLQQGWSPQARDGGRYSLGTLALAHALETVSGWALLTGILVGLVTPWLLPIALSLAFAIPLSALSGLDLGARGSRHLGTRETYAEPPVLRAARTYRAELKTLLQAPATPAE